MRYECKSSIYCSILTKWHSRASGAEIWETATQLVQYERLVHKSIALCAESSAHIHNDQHENLCGKYLSEGAYKLWVNQQANLKKKKKQKQITAAIQKDIRIEKNGKWDSEREETNEELVPDVQVTSYKRFARVDNIWVRAGHRLYKQHFYFERISLNSLTKLRLKLFFRREIKTAV